MFSSPRQSLRIRKYSPKTSGVSLMPAATPTRNPLPGKPLVQRRFRDSRSAAIRPMSRMLICPKARVSRQGPRFSTARTSTAAPQRLRAGSKVPPPVRPGVPVPHGEQGQPPRHDRAGRVEHREGHGFRQPGQQAEEQRGKGRVRERQLGTAGPVNVAAVKVRRRCPGLVEDLAAVPVDTEVEALLRPDTEPGPHQEQHRGQGQDGGEPQQLRHRKPLRQPGELRRHGTRAARTAYGGGAAAGGAGRFSASSSDMDPPKFG